jgi:hypothetical protein
VLKESFLKEHRTVFWNIILYFRIMKLPVFMLDLDYSPVQVKAQVTQIKKYLPNDKKLTSIMGLSQIPPKQPSSINKVENSPARKSSISRLTASVLDKVLGNSTAKNPPTKATESFNGSDRGSNSGFPTGTMEINRESEVQMKNQQSSNTNRGSFFGGGGSTGAGPQLRRVGSSHKSGGSGGGGSVVTSLSDLERIERIMTQAQHANKSIVKYFGKHLEEFRREQTYSKEIILSDPISQGISEAMQKHI